MVGLSESELNRAKTNPELRESLHSRVLGRMTDCNLLSDDFEDLRDTLHLLDDLRSPKEWHDITRAA